MGGALAFASLDVLPRLKRLKPRKTDRRFVGESVVGSAADVEGVTVDAAPTAGCLGDGSGESERPGGTCTIAVWPCSVS